MTFSLKDGGAFPDPLGYWTLPPEPLFVGSEQFDKLSRDLERYVKGEIQGRSYLIAGHRGSGKTALVIRAVQDLRTRILRDSVKEESEPVRDADGLQRPLVVKLHGPSLVNPPDAPKPDDAKANGAGGAQAGADQAKEAGPAGAGDAQPTDTPQPAPIVDGAHAALVQITIGLYRALASEAAFAFNVHARDLSDGRVADLSERAAQFALDLDGGPDAAALRRCWDALGRLSAGLFWPRLADRTLAARDLQQQGMREVMAIATAAQAFQVCTGHVTYKTTVQDNASKASESTIKGSTDLKDVIGRVSTLGVGALTGVSLLGATDVGAVAAVAAGLAVWVIGNLSLNWSVTRKDTRNQTLDYIVIRDREVTTLDRDLPLVIQRVREAGLAPVFVIDELDKVDNALNEIGDVVKRLKHLVSDYGFFCFLVNRDVYHQVDRLIEDKPYPVQHTYFSQRLLVRPDTHRLMVYLAQVLKEDPPTSAGERARTIFALATMHRAKFNLTELTRAIADVAGAGTQLRIADSELTSNKQVLAATVQAAINEILREPRLVDRMGSDPSFAQLVIDTLYYPSRAWERDEGEFRLTRAGLRTYLTGRMASDDGIVPPEDTIPKADVDQLYRLCDQLLKDLTDFSRLAERMGDRLAFDDFVVRGLPDQVKAELPMSVKLRAILPSAKALLVRAQPRTRLYAFLYDSQGVDAKVSDGPWREELVSEAETMIKVADAFVAILAKLAIGLDELADAKLVPAISQADLDLSRSAIQASIDSDQMTPEASTGLDRLRQLTSALRDGGNAIGSALLLVASVARAAGTGAGTFGRVARLVNFSAAPGAWLAGSVPPDHPVAADAAALDAWRDEADDRLMAKPPDPATPTVPQADYGKLRRPLLDHFQSGSSILPPFSYEELIYAAKELAPQRYLHFDLNEMRVSDWSGLALQAMPSGSGWALAPYWLLVAALRGLGFGKSLLGELVDETLLPDLKNGRWLVSAPGLTPEDCMIYAGEFAAGAPERPAGVLLLRGEQDAAALALASQDRRPTLLIGEQEGKDYIGPIHWLSALGFFAGVVDEERAPKDAGASP